MKEFCLGREVDLPVTAFEFPAEINVFIPGGIEMFIEPTGVVVGLAPDHESGSGNLIDSEDGGGCAVIDRAFRTELT
jgi:hypothetical protein